MRLLLCDDHAIFREGLKTVLADLTAEIEEAGSIEEALDALARDADVDVVLLDLRMPGTDGFTGLRKIRSEFPTVPVVIVSASERPADARWALENGASGFISKSSSSSVFRSALQLVLDGSTYLPPSLLREGESVDDPDAVEPPSDAPRPVRRGRRDGGPSLTPRQREILQMMSRGLTNAEIAGVLKIAEATVKTHISAILQALDVSNRTEAALVMRELDLED